MTKDNNNGKRNGKWIKLGKAIAALAIAVGALATSITGLVKSNDAQDTAKASGNLAADLATNPEADAVYEALLLQIQFLQRQVEGLQRRVDDLVDRPTTWDRVTMGPPEAPPPVPTAHEDGEGSMDTPEHGTGQIGLSGGPQSAPRKAADLPRLKAAREKRAGMLRQVQQQLQED